MRTRHRNNGNGRSNSMGMGGGLSAGRHNGEYRNFNRGYGRGPPKHFPPPQTPRKSDIFMEAGRLAAEYLVSQGFLPPEVLPGKWQNGSLKTQIEDFQEFKSQDREQLQMPSEGRMPAHARLGNAVHDAGFLKRRFPDDLNPTGSRGKKRSESFKGYSSDWGKENGSSGSWSEKSKPFSDMEVEDGFVSVNNEEDQQVGLDVSGGVPEVISNEIPLSDKISEFNSNDISSIGDDAGTSLISDTAVTNDTILKRGSSSCKKELQPQAAGEISKDSDDSNVLSMDEEVKPGMTGGKIDKDEAAEKVSMQYPAVEGDAMNKNANDLLRLCTFAKVPTRARSLLPYKGSKVDLVPITIEEDTCVAVAAPLEEPKVTTEKNSVVGFSDGTLTNQTQSSKCFDSDIIGAAAVQSLEDARDPEPASEDRGKCTRTQSFPGTSSFMHQEDLDQDSSGFGRCSSLIERGEKRSLQNDDYREWSKKPREWSSYVVVDADEHYHLQNFEAKPSSSHQGRHLPDIEVVKAVGLETLADDSLLSKGGAESGVELKEERQFFPSSFKICDLNLMESSDMTEHHDTDPVLDSPSTLEAKKGLAVDVDSSMSNNCKTSNDFRGLVHGKEVIIVNLDNDSENEDKGFHTPDRKNEAVYSGGLESFPNNMENTDHLPDAQDGYGLMISELLGTDIPNCSSVPADITSLPTEMSLHNEAGILCDDDPIFLSLGEIPISFPGVWPEKPF